MCKSQSMTKLHHQRLGENGTGNKTTLEDVRENCQTPNFCLIICHVFALNTESDSQFEVNYLASRALWLVNSVDW